MSHEYAFDATVMVALRVNAEAEQTARDKLAAFLDCASVNLGELDGETVVCEASLHGRPSLYEMDGEPVDDGPTLLDELTNIAEEFILHMRQGGAISDTVNAAERLVTTYRSNRKALSDCRPTRQLDALPAQFGGYWDGAHPLFPVKDWQQETISGSTRSGYWQWVADQIGAQS